MADFAARLEHLERLMGIGSGPPEVEEHGEHSGVPVAARQLQAWLNVGRDGAKVVTGLAIGTEHGACTAYGTWATPAEFTLDTRAVAGICQALANDTRLAMLRELFPGRRSTAELMAAVGIDRGPLYHHLRDLFVQGLIAQPERGSYALTGRGVSILLAVSLLPNLGEPIDRLNESALELDDEIASDTPTTAPAEQH